MSATASMHFNNGLRYRDAHDPAQTQLTPEYVLGPVRRALGGTIDLDPCTTIENPCDASRFYAPPVDGLQYPWRGRIFVNPPYGKARESWVRKCAVAGCNGSRVVLLIPSATDTRIFQEALASATAVVFIKGRVKFGVLRPNRRQAAASHPSALIGWNLDLHECSELGARVVIKQEGMTPSPSTGTGAEDTTGMA
jgi:hypothetical protein